MVVSGYARPDYRVHEFFDGFYKLVKFKNSDRLAVSLHDHAQDEHYDEKLAPSYSRARSVVLQLALCNQWEYFFTGTIDEKLLHRDQLFPFLSRLVQWFRDLRKNGVPVRFLLVPEKHSDLKAWHVHGLLSGIPESELYPFVPGIHPPDLVEGGFLNWPAYAEKFGFCSLGRVRDRVGTAFYVTKYISKDLAARGNSGVRCRLYTSSRGLRRAVPFGDIYGSYSGLDAYLTHDYDFCRTGFVKCSWGDWLDYLDTGPDEVVETVIVPDTPCEEWEQMVIAAFGRGEVSWLRE